MQEKPEQPGPETPRSPVRLSSLLQFQRARNSEGLQRAHQQKTQNVQSDLPDEVSATSQTD